MSNFILLKDLEVYKLARELSDLGWSVYENLNWQDKKVIGDQFIRAIDSVGANIAEGYARFHYLEKIKFYYISRGSLSEGCDHWLELLWKRKKINEIDYYKMKEIHNRISIKLRNFIVSTHNSKVNYNKFK